MTALPTLPRPGRRAAALCAALLCTAAPQAAPGAAPAEAAQRGEIWYVRIVGQHVHRQFCPDNDTSLAQLVQTADAYALAHGSRLALLSEAEVLQAWTERHPCAGKPTREAAPAAAAPPGTN